LADALARQNVEVWYDEFSLELGDSIRRSIDKGLSRSRFAIVVLSRSFFRKNWTQYELDGLTELEMRGHDKVLLPIWHDLTHSEVLAYSPALANRKAVMSADGVDAVVSAVLRVLRPQGSPLIHARDLLLERGVTPPVITDAYWLEVTEASNRIGSSGAVVPDEAVWGRWSFPLPEKEGGPENWGERLAWTAMQLAWTKDADILRITPLTPPREVLEFVESQPGLAEACEFFPGLLVEYAPQLLIPGMGGRFEALLSEEYLESAQAGAKRRQENSPFGSALTTDHKSPLCDEEWALRDPDFGRYEASMIANAYFAGGIFGPPVSPYEHTDHLVWLLSRGSAWLPERIHDVLLTGMAEWGVWHWQGDWKSAGTLRRRMDAVRRGGHFRWTSESTDDAVQAFGRSIDVLGLPEKPEEILGEFTRNDVVGVWLRDRDTSTRRRRR
jgi:hypothetical protein